MIELKSISKSFSSREADVHALRGVDLRVGKGEIFGVMGASGAGKSTLIRCINLLEKPDSGQVYVDSQEITSLSGAGLSEARRKMGMIFQHFNLLSSRTSLANVALPLEIAGMEKAERLKKAEEMLKLVGLEDKRNAYPSQLSGGQKQRVGIARALATDPTILLSDEATSALDPASTQSILELLKDLNQRLGLTILMITHQVEVVRAICDHVAVLEEGICVEQGDLLELLRDPLSKTSQTLFPPISEANLPDGSQVAVITFFGKDADEPILASLVRKFDVNANILGGNIQEIAGQRVGQLQVELRGEQAPQAIDYLRNLGLHVEVRR